MFSLAAYVHQLDPYAIKLWEDGPIRWYGLSYLAGFVIGFFLIRRVARVGVSTLKPGNVMDLIVATAIGVVVGGRLGYCLFYRPELFITFTSDAPWWGALAINDGGMASHGGFIGVIGGCMYYAWRHKHSFGHLLDLTMFASPIGLGLGRIANFVNGELLGRPCDEDFPLAVKFPQEIAQWRDPDQLDQLRPAIEQMQQVNATPGGPIIDPQAHVHDLLHFIQEGSGIAHGKVIELIEPLLIARHPSQLYQGVAEGVVLMGVLLVFWLKPRKPGLVFSVTVTTYSVLRMITEMFREPDAHLRGAEFAQIGLTRGQMISIATFLVGAAAMFWFARRKVEPMGGWLPAKAGKQESREAGNEDV